MVYAPASPYIKSHSWQNMTSADLEDYRSYDCLKRNDILLKAWRLMHRSCAQFSKIYCDY